MPSCPAAHRIRCWLPPRPGPAPGCRRVTSRTSGMPLRNCRLLTRILDLVLGAAGRLGDVRGDACGQAGWGGDWLNVVPVLVQQVPDLGEGSPDGAAAG